TPLERLAKSVLPSRGTRRSSFLGRHFYRIRWARFPCSHALSNRVQLKPTTDGPAHRLCDRGALVHGRVPSSAQTCAAVSRAFGEDPAELERDHHSAKSTFPPSSAV